MLLDGTRFAGLPKVNFALLRASDGHTGRPICVFRQACEVLIFEQSGAMRKSRNREVFTIHSLDAHGLLGAFQKALGSWGEVIQAQHGGAQLSVGTGNQRKDDHTGVALL